VTQNKKIELKLVEGNIFFNVTQQLQPDESFEIQTSTMLLGLRGTSGFVTTNDRGNSCVIVTDGTVQVTGINPATGERKEIQVTAGQKATVATYSERPVDGVVFKQEQVHENDLPALALTVISGNDALMDKVCRETRWSPDTIRYYQNQGPGMGPASVIPGFDGPQGSWKQDANGWWFQRMDGSYPAGTWEWIDSNGDGVSECYYFYSNGYLAQNTVIDGSYVNASGEWVFLNTTEKKGTGSGAGMNSIYGGGSTGGTGSGGVSGNGGSSSGSAGGGSPSEGVSSNGGTWHSDNNGWWYQRADGSYPAGTWEWIDSDGDGISECYYFYSDGYMAYNNDIDGNHVDNNGQWTVGGEVQKQGESTTGGITQGTAQGSSDNAASVYAPIIRAFADAERNRYYGYTWDNQFDLSTINNEFRNAGYVFENAAAKQAEGDQNQMEYYIGQLPGSGKEILLIGYNGSPICVYTSVNGSAKNLMPDYEWMERNQMFIYDDGSIMTHGSGSAMSGTDEYYRFSDDGEQLVLTDRFIYDWDDPATLVHYGTTYQGTREEMEALMDSYSTTEINIPWKNAADF
jgi:hypothetical protein